MGVVLYNKLVYNIVKNHYTLFPLHPLFMNLDMNKGFGDRVFA